MAGTIDVANKLTKDYNITLTSAKSMIVTVLDSVIDIAKTERIKVGNHIFKPVTRKERKGRNPKTGDELIIPEKQTIKYKYTGNMS
jgi:Bacterial nucleoid DNA-binding protein